MCREPQDFKTFLKLNKVFETSVLISYVAKMAKLPKAEFDLNILQRRKKTKQKTHKSMWGKYGKHRRLFHSVQVVNL